MERRKVTQSLLIVSNEKKKHKAYSKISKHSVCFKFLLFMVRPLQDFLVLQDISVYYFLWLLMRKVLLVFGDMKHCCS